MIHSSGVNAVCQPRPLSAISTSPAGITPIMVDDKPVIFWHLDEDYLTNDMSKMEQVFMISQSFAFLQPSMGAVEFRSTSEADESAIVIKFMRNGDEGLPTPFQNNVLAYAYFPSGKSLAYHSDIFVNDNIRWTDGWKNIGTNGRQTISHEIGHSLGMDHSDIRSSLMWPSIIQGLGRITQDIVDSLEKLYSQYWTEVETTPTPAPEEKGGRCIELLRSLFGKNKRLLRSCPRRVQVAIGKYMGLDVTEKTHSHLVVDAIYKGLQKK